MFTIKEYVKPNTINEAYEILISKKNNTVIGGSAFLKMGSKKIGTAIDLANLNLNYIKDKEGYIEIGAYTTLRDLETNQLLKENFKGVIPNSVKNIVGVQFRNIANIGASVFSKYGFSDIITALLALDTEVELAKTGRIKLDEFLNSSYEKDILTKIFIKKNQRVAVYKDLRNSVSDYPILNVSVSRLEDNFKICVGARPNRAKIAFKASRELSNSKEVTDLDYYANIASDELNFGTNDRASKDYRKAVSKILIKRAIKELL